MIAQKRRWHIWRREPKHPDLTLGERAADFVANAGSSWAFVICFFLFMGMWIAANSVEYLWRPFDPYPFILFNLVLSTLAAIQAPIIMMSQKRIESRNCARDDTHFKITQAIAKGMERLLELMQEISVGLTKLLVSKSEILRNQRAILEKLDGLSKPS